LLLFLLLLLGLYPFSFAMEYIVEYARPREVYSLIPEMFGLFIWKRVRVTKKDVDS
jgi:hypothetical protein